MLGRSNRKHDTGQTLTADLADAVRDQMATAWLTPDGTLLDATPRFCGLMGYDLSDLVGKSHDILLDPKDRESEEYRAFWSGLRKGENQTADTFARVDSHGGAVWVGANYVPLMDDAGTLRRIVLFARDVSKRVRDNAEAQSRLDALDRSQARIEFDLDGTIRYANDNFLKTVGYRREEVLGQHHRMFLFPADREAAAYREFWKDLSEGQFKSGEFRRTGKDGQEIWLQATYNPIFNTRGQPTGVVKLASDITDAKNDSLLAESRLRALDLSQAIIGFGPDGTIRSANANFLSAVGYTMEEILGRHHSMFMPDGEGDTAEYRQFWDDLRAGQVKSGEFRRVAKGGGELWLQAAYNPIVDGTGKVIAVEKFAYDITPTKHAILVFGEAISRLAANDLSVRITEDVPREFTALKQQFNDAVGALSTVLEGISERADRIRSDTTQIDSAATDLSTRTERQAATLEETAAALDQVAASVRNAARSAEEASKTSISAEESTTSGMETVRRAVEAMNEIARSSAEVSKITDVIDGLAFQTNLLALNAGVEAARAGETGRGFAVVASEVRQLAQRSSEASQEIAALIRTTSSQVEGGVKLVGESGGALEQIAEFVREIRDQVANLATAAQEQSNGLDDINTAATELDKVTQQNAAMFEETTAATQSLAREVEELSDSTRAFSFSDQAEDGDGTWSQPMARRA